MKIAEKIGECIDLGEASVFTCRPIAGRIPNSRAFLAPLSGVTDITMRRIALRYGAGLVVSEMVASDEFVIGSEEARLRAEGSDITPHVVQLAGCEARWMSEAARLAEASGADMIDINMGCPAKKVTGGLAGSALMRDLDHAVSLITAVIGAVSCPVSVKMRLGWDETSLNAAALALRAEGEGAAMVTIHGRTRQQFYKGQADWTAIAGIKQAVTIPVVANGDIADLASAQSCLAQSGADFVMIGRAALGRPWLVGDVGRMLDGKPANNLTASDKRQIAREHYEGLLHVMGRHAGVRHARKHLAAYSEPMIVAGRPDMQAIRTRMLTTDDPTVAMQAMTAIFDAAEMQEAAA